MTLRGGVSSTRGINRSRVRVKVSSLSLSGPGPCCSTGLPTGSFTERVVKGGLAWSTSRGNPPPCLEGDDPFRSLLLLSLPSGADTFFVCTPFVWRTTFFVGWLAHFCGFVRVPHLCVKAHLLLFHKSIHLLCPLRVHGV